MNKLFSLHFLYHVKQSSLLHFGVQIVSLSDWSLLQIQEKIFQSNWKSGRSWPTTNRNFDHWHMCAYKGIRNTSFSENFAYILNEWPAGGFKWKTYKQGNRQVSSSRDDKEMLSVLLAVQGQKVTTFYSTNWDSSFEWMKLLQQYYIPLPFSNSLHRKKWSFYSSILIPGFLNSKIKL